MREHYSGELTETEAAAEELEAGIAATEMAAAEAEYGAEAMAEAEAEAEAEGDYNRRDYGGPTPQEYWDDMMTDFRATDHTPGLWDDVLDLDDEPIFDLKKEAPEG